MSRKTRLNVRKGLLVVGSLTIWMIFMFPYAHYAYWPGEYERGAVLWETERHIEVYTVPDSWRWLIADTGGEFYAAQGFVPCWNTLDKDVFWPGVLAAAATIVALCGAGFWTTRDRVRRPAQDSPFHTWEAQAESKALPSAPRPLA